MKLVIPGKLPGTNEIIDAAKGGRGRYQPYAQMKEEYTNLVAFLARQLPHCEKATLKITWYEPNRKRDPDNIMGGQKFILDGLVLAGIIPNDSQKYIKGVTHQFAIDRSNPRVEVEIFGAIESSQEFKEQELWD